ncbi:nickel-responsive transcriptional regulator NikR [Halomonas qinghailakensis]|uniref:Putative nickel-responsive regulator n=2 Tax=Halomonas TaxID=2745 RepID=A0AA46YS10_9GAMM|nr:MULTISPECIES: nickel-responsive transcriptional regulator NikR [Halomonas]UYO75067.1 nickel-responsive transcriptional regulator NikR [Halomonas sp. ZZQ-149]UYV20024.1 nickel-responsive transcriptional regulator NikR [Halomonas qaidamensis]
MQRVTVTLDEDLLSEVDALMHARGYQNRSETIRDLTRSGLKQAKEEVAPEAPCMGALVYVYDHAARDLSKRLTRHSHDHHDLTLSTLHVHINQDSCLEVALLKGQGSALKQFSDEVTSSRSVRYGQLVIIPEE